MWKIFVLFNFFIYCAYGQEVRPVDSAPVTNLSISAIWDECTQSVYYVDFYTTGQQHTIFRYDYKLDKTFGAFIDGVSSAVFITPLKDCNKFKHLFVVGFGHSTAIIQWDGKSNEAKIVNTVFKIQENDPTSLMGVARQSEHGHFYGGSFHASFCSGPYNASFYRYSARKGLQLLFTGAQTTTGLAFDKNAGMLYQIDTCSGLITGYRMDRDGNICNGRIIYDFSKSGLYLIGLEADCDGMLYTGGYADGAIYQINPRTSSARRVAQLPVDSGVGGVTFGGSDRRTLFAIVGSSVIDPLTGQIIKRNNGPSLYRINGLGARGRKYSRLMF